MTKDAFIAEVTFKVYDLQSVHPPPRRFCWGGLNLLPNFHKVRGGGLTGLQLLDGVAFFSGGGGVQFLHKR